MTFALPAKCSSNACAMLDWCLLRVLNWVATSQGFQLFLVKTDLIKWFLEERINHNLMRFFQDTREELEKVGQFFQTYFFKLQYIFHPGRRHTYLQFRCICVVLFTKRKKLALFRFLLIKIRFLAFQSYYWNICVCFYSLKLPLGWRQTQMQLLTRSHPYALK